MKLLRLLVLLPLFCTLHLCMGERHCTESENCNVDYSLSVWDNEDYIQIVRSSYFCASSGANNVAERTPVQFLKVNGTSARGLRNGHNSSRSGCNASFGSLFRCKESLSGTFYGKVQYNAFVPVWDCHNSSKCHILALGKIRC
ncbi:MAG: hypothetical protein E7121_02260 [Bacteroidales bacterium]|nr:hypothetical protein [Bacteroidales bacterium]